MESPVFRVLIGKFTGAVAGKILARFDRLLSGPRWKYSSLAIIIAWALFRAFPSYDALRTEIVDSTWRSAQIKFDHPFADTSRLFASGSHESNLTFRLSIPVIAHV